MFLEGLFILAILCLLVAISEWLVANTAFKHFGTALLVILLTAIVANIGILPAGSPPENPVPVYDGIFGYVAPLAIFLLLLQVNLRDILKAGKPLIALFMLGAIGTAAGVVLGMYLINGAEVFGENFVGLGGMFVGTYTGGGINFNALAIHYGLIQEGVLYGGVVAIDNIMTAIWMVVTIAIPRLLGSLWQHRKPQSFAQPLAGADTDISDTEQISPFEIGMLLFIGFLALWLSDLISNELAEVGFRAPSIVIVSVLALIIAQFPFAQKLRGAQVMGSFCVTLFLAVIGAFCDISALGSIGAIGANLMILVVVIVLVHGLLVFGAAWIFKMDPAMAAVASQANIGGSPSALALAKSIGRPDLVLPAVLVGSLGYAVGTFLGLGVAEYILTAFTG